MFERKLLVLMSLILASLALMGCGSPKNPEPPQSMEDIADRIFGTAKKVNLTYRSFEAPWVELNGEQVDLLYQSIREASQLEDVKCPRQRLSDGTVVIENVYMIRDQDTVIQVYRKGFTVELIYQWDSGFMYVEKSSMNTRLTNRGPVAYGPDDGGYRFRPSAKFQELCKDFAP